MHRYAVLCHQYASDQENPQKERERSSFITVALDLNISALHETLLWPRVWKLLTSNR
jgi:hypothetical protein